MIYSIRFLTLYRFMKTILISGGAGYLGTELTQSLLKKYNVIIYDSFNFPWIINNKKKIKNNHRLKFIKKDIQDVNIKDFNKVDYVCDLNGIPNDPASELNPKKTWDINYRSRYNFAKKAKDAKVGRYIFNSTCSVFGHNKNTVFENSVKKPISTYAKANLKAEKKIYKLKDKNFKINILRNSTLFGFSNTMRLDLVINIYVYKLMQKKKIMVDGDGQQWRPFISVKDICGIYNYILQRENLPSFICNLVAFNSTIKLLANRIAKTFGKNKNFIVYNKSNFDKRNYKVGSKNFKKLFKKFKFSNFSKEVRKLNVKIKFYKIRQNSKTIRMLYYKKLFA